MADTSLLPPRRMHPIHESDENISGHAHLYNLSNTSNGINAPSFSAKILLASIRTFINNFKAPSDPSLLSLLLYIKQLNESVTDLLRYNNAHSSQDCQQILQYLDGFNNDIVAHLNKSRNAMPSQPSPPPPQTTTNAVIPKKGRTPTVGFEDYDRVIKTP